MERERFAFSTGREWGRYVLGDILFNNTWGFSSMEWRNSYTSSTLHVAYGYRINWCKSFTGSIAKFGKFGKFSLTAFFGLVLKHFWTTVVVSESKK